MLLAANMSGRASLSLRRQAEHALANWDMEERRRTGLRAGHFSPVCQRARGPRVQPQSRCIDEGGDRWASYAHLQELNRTMSFEPLSVEDAGRIENEALEQCRDDVLDRKVCAVTDTWVFPKDAKRIQVNVLPFRAMRAVLAGAAWCTPAITEYYDCSAIDPRLTGLLLSQRGFCQGEDGISYVWISSAVLRDLHALEVRLAQSTGLVADAKPPRFAIADGFVCGVYPEIDNTTCIERQALGLAQIRGLVKVVYGGPGHMLNSHLLCWDNRDATIASRVPSVVTRKTFQLILAGPMTKAQELLLAKRHECDGGRIREAHDLLRRINPLYASIRVNAEALATPDDPNRITTRVDQDRATEELIAEARARQATVAHQPEVAANVRDRECTIVETQTVLMETSADQNEQDRLARAFAHVAGGTNVYVARRSTSLLQSTDPHFIERLFPHLLTFGVGGFSTPRTRRYAARDVVLHYLNVSSNRFAEDPMFKLVMFDYISTKRVKSSVYLRVGQDPSLATTAMRVTPEQLKIAMRGRELQRKAWKDGRTFTPPAGVAAANTLLRSINASTSKMWGSNEERVSMARKVDAMTILHGAPSIFWTLTPNPDHSLVCAFWTGKELPGGRPEQLSQCGELHMPCPSEMTRLIMANTTVQVQYYQLCCRLLIDIIFGWDSTANKPKSQRGIFGFVEALVYAMEQQGRLHVHHHGVAWVAGMPRSKSDWDRVLGCPQLREKFERYCASIFSAELPVYKNITTLVCPLSGRRGELTPVPLNKKFRHILKSSVPAPAVARCDVCEKLFSESEIVQSIIDKQWDELDDDNKALSTPAAVEAIRSRFGGLSKHTATSDIQLTRLLLKDQVHSWTHTRSCIKGQSGSRCRYKFYRNLVEATGLSSSCEMGHRRRIGNQWLNTYIPLWRRIMHFNMDARMLWSGEGLQASRYALQYTMKRQTVLDNVAVVNIAFRQRVSREMELQTTQYGQAIGRLLSLAYASSGVMEIGGPLATAILHAGGAVTFGCMFERLVLVDGLNLLNNVTVEATVTSRNQSMLAETSIAKYVQRPRCLESFCWYDFTSWFCRVGSSISHGGERCGFTSHDAQLLREHVKEHGYRYHDYPRVPEIIGPRLPDATRLGDDDYEEQSELYYRMAPLLYQPFRDARTFLDAGNSALSHYENWLPTVTAATTIALERHQLHYTCLESAQTYRDKLRSSGEESSDDEDMCDHPDVMTNAREQPGVCRSSARYEAVPSELYATVGDEDGDGDIDIDMDLDDSMQVDDEAADAVEIGSPLEQLLHASIAGSNWLLNEPERYRANDKAITKTQVQQFQTTHQELENAPHEHGVSSLHTTEVTVDVFDRAIRDLHYHRGRQPPAHLAAYASIQDVSRYYSLNSLQHTAFTLIAVPLLTMIASKQIPAPHNEIFDKSPIIVTGAGGTGKSQIVEAVRALATSWGRPLAVYVSATTGIAAAGLQGCTMHSSVSLGINAKHIPKHIQEPTDSLLQRWAPVLCVIADELSMVDHGFFGLWEESIRCAKENMQEDFGGVLPVLMFDHCQLRTCSGFPMFKAKSGGVLTPAQDRGFELYRSIKKVVYLTENMRFNQDPEWGEWLASARLGNWKPECRAYLASLHSSAASQLQGHNTLLTVSTDNATRVATNDKAIRVAVSCFGATRKVYVIPAHLSQRLLPQELALLRQMPDNKTGHVPLFLQIYVGMPVRVKANQCLAKGVANGAAAFVYHIDWHPDTDFALQTDGTWLADRQPLNIYVDVQNTQSRVRFKFIPEHWPVSVMPVHQVSVSIKLGGRYFSIKGYPIVPAFGTTVHGVQGATLDTIAVANLRPSNVSRVDTHAMYVTLSRVRTRHGLRWLGALPSAEDYEFFRPESDVLVEDNRLRHLAHKTVSLVDLALCTTDTSFV